MSDHCRKIRYWKQVDAMLALARADGAAKRQRKRPERRQEYRVYRCDVCTGRPWHLTSQPA